MNAINKSVFAKMAKVSKPMISKLLREKKIVQDINGHIDIDIPINKNYLIKIGNVIGRARAI